MTTITIDLKAGWNTFIFTTAFVDPAWGAVKITSFPLNPDTEAVFPTATVVYRWDEGTKNWNQAPALIEKDKIYRVAVLDDTTYTIDGEPIGGVNPILIALVIGLGIILLRKK